jgi:hypothetical protein
VVSPPLPPITLDQTDVAGFEIFNRMFKKWEGTSWEMSPGMGNFMAGGLASNMYWLTALREYSTIRGEL